MRDPKWIGTSPFNIFWSPDSRKVYFNRNPEQSLAENESIDVGGNPGVSPADSLYYITLKDHTPRKVPVANRSLAEAERYGSWNADKTKLVFAKDHSPDFPDIATGKINKLFQNN